VFYLLSIDNNAHYDRIREKKEEEKCSAWIKKKSTTT